MSYETIEYDPELALDAIEHFALLFFHEYGVSDENAQLLFDAIDAGRDEAGKLDAFDRLYGAVERAFNRLRINGYLCEQNWHCCRSCGWQAIPDEDADQAVWYHGQDTEEAFATGKLWLVWQGDAALIRQALEAEGLTVDHDGSVESRIRVEMAA